MLACYKTERKIKVATNVDGMLQCYRVLGVKRKRLATAGDIQALVTKGQHVSTMMMDKYQFPSRNVIDGNVVRED